MWLLPLSFSVNFIVQNLRLSLISGKYYFGFATDPLHFLGFSFSGNSSLNFENKDLPAYQAAALLKLDYNRIWENLPIALFIYPILFILLSFVLFFILQKFNQKIRFILYVFMIFFGLLHLLSILNVDPRIVIPVD